MSVMGTGRVLSALLQDNMLMSAFGLYIVTYIIDLLMSTHSKRAAGLLCLCSTSEKVVTVFCFFQFLLAHFFARVPTKREA